MALVGGVLLAVLVVVTRGLLEQAASPAPPTRDELCAEYESLVAELSGDALFATQSAIRSSRKLSQMAGLYVQPIAMGDQDVVVAEPPVSQADADMRRVLQAVAWETSDLVAATRPIALECGWSWPVTASPPQARPEPPTK